MATSAIAATDAAATEATPDGGIAVVASAQQQQQ